MEDKAIPWIHQECIKIHADLKWVNWWRLGSPWAWPSTLAFKTSPDQCQLFFWNPIADFPSGFLQCERWSNFHRWSPGPSTWANYSTSFMFDVSHYFVHFRRTSPEHAVHTHTRSRSSWYQPNVAISSVAPHHKTFPALSYVLASWRMPCSTGGSLWDHFGVIAVAAFWKYIASPSTSSEEDWIILYNSEDSITFHVCWMVSCVCY